MITWSDVVSDCSEDARAMLAKSYEGELVGIGMFRQLAAAAGSEADRRGYEALQLVEEALASQFAPDLIAALDVDPVEAEVKASSFASSWLGAGWREVCAAILPEAEVSLREFHWLKRQVPAALQPVTQALIDHEEALVEIFRTNAAHDESIPDLELLNRLLDSIGA